MKKIMLICAILVGCLLGYTQEDEGAADLVSKKGVKIKPVAGEIGLGFNAVPIFNYFGNFFNGNLGNDILNNSYFVNSDNMIYVKYFLEDDMAVRLRARIRDIKTTNMNMVVEQGQSDPEVKVEDRWARNDQLFALNAGVQLSRGKGRVQGIYGVELFWETSKMADRFTWGNEMVTPHIAPETTTDFFTGASANLSDRILSQNFGRTHTFGIDGFLGVEYFFAPKVSISGEFTWGVARTLAGDTETVSQKYTDKVEEITVSNAGARVFTMDTGNYGGAICLMFYF